MSNTRFFAQVYSVVRQIPAGRVTSYGAVARYIGSAGAARMVGWALNKCYTESEYVPAHRVVNQQGLLTGQRHFGGNSMHQLLQAEGINIQGNQIQDLKAVFWDPAKELNKTDG